MGLLGFTDKAEIMGESPDTASIDPAFTIHTTHNTQKSHSHHQLYLFCLYTSLASSLLNIIFFFFNNNNNNNKYKYLLLRDYITRDIKLDPVAKDNVVGVGESPVVNHQMVWDTKILLL